MPMEMGIADKTALITGGAHGLGKAICISLAEEGANIAMNYRRDPLEAEELANLIINKYKVRVECIRGDVSVEESVNALFADTIKKFGSVDILVNNSGICPTSLVKDMEIEEWEQVIRTNLTGTFLTCRQMVNHLVDKKLSGKIINIASQSAFNGSKSGKSHYSASKGGVVTFTHSLAKEVAQYGISVNAVAPGMMYTEMTAELLDKKMELYKKDIPIGRIAEVDEIAKVVTFLASSAASYITGTTLDVSGGMVGR